MRSRNCLAYVDNASMWRRWPSAYSVSNASVLFPDPDGPVITVSARRGSSTVIPLRLCCRALRMMTRWGDEGITLENNRDLGFGGQGGGDRLAQGPEPQTRPAHMASPFIPLRLSCRALLMMTRWWDEGITLENNRDLGFGGQGGVDRLAPGPDPQYPRPHMALALTPRLLRRGLELFAVISLIGVAVV